MKKAQFWANHVDSIMQKEQVRPARPGHHMRYNEATDLTKNSSTLMLSLAVPKVSGAQETKKHGNDESPI